VLRAGGAPGVAGAEGVGGFRVEGAELGAGAGGVRVDGAEDSAAGRGDGVGADGAAGVRVEGADDSAGVRVDGAAPGRGADGVRAWPGADGRGAPGVAGLGLGVEVVLGAAGAALRATGADGAGRSAAAGAGASFSLRRRITGASRVDEGDLTNSPMSLAIERTALLSTPSSLASS
jgi:hypothetical protein